MKALILKAVCLILVMLSIGGCTSGNKLALTTDEDVAGTKGENDMVKFENAKVGDVISFGSLALDDTNSDIEKILWKVLSVEKNRVLLLTTEGIDCKLYNTEAIETNWEKCSVRKWLNDDFLTNAFTEQETCRIVSSDISFFTESQEESICKDKLFLLSVSEAETYFSSDRERVCKPNSRALKNGAYADEKEGNSSWWLRSSGASAERAALVDETGAIDKSGDGVYCDGNVIRPAMWIYLDNSVPNDGASKENNEKKPIPSTTKKPSVTTKGSGLLSSTPVYPTEEKLERPKKKEEIVNILVIGNSCAYYFMDELEGMASAAGYNVNVYNAYYSLSSGNQVDAHWSNLTIDKNNSDKNTYKFFKTANGSRNQLVKSITLDAVVSYTDWDVIVMNESVRPRKADTYEAMYKNTVEDGKRLYDYFKEKYPSAALFWYQGFSYEIGWTASNDETEYMTTKERQDTNHENIRLASKLICQQNKIGLLPVGDAWQLARLNPVFGQHLTERWANGEHKEDHYHDGESGGQYLNACVFFEGIFQKSCIGNTFFPKAEKELEYDLTSEKVKQLQEIAHQSIAEIYGSDFAK